MIPAPSLNNNRSVFQLNGSLDSSFASQGIPFNSFCFNQQGSCSNTNCLAKYYPPSPFSLLSALLLVLFLLICALEVTLQRVVHQKTSAWTLFNPPGSTTSLFIPPRITASTSSLCRVCSPPPLSFPLCYPSSLPSLPLSKYECSD